MILDNEVETIKVYLDMEEEGSIRWKGLNDELS